MPGTRSAFAERAAGGYFVDLDLRRDEIARYGLSVAAVQDVVMSAIGGENVTTTVEGRARFPVNVRYPRDLRSDLETLGRVLVMTPSGAQVPLAQVADIRTVTGPSMIRNENGLLVGYVYVDITGRDVGGYVDDAKRAVAAAVKLPSGYALEWSGQYENMQRVTERLKLVVPFTLFLILFLLYANTKSLAKTLIVVLAVPFSVIGAVWLLWALDYNVSIAVWVGMIALMGLDAETGVFMLLFLDLAYDEAKAKGRLRSMADLHEAIIHGAVKRLRPKMMTVTAAMIGLMPIMWSIGTGSDVMKRVAAPMVGGLATSFALELLVYPAIYLLWRWHTEVRHRARGGDVVTRARRRPRRRRRDEEDVVHAAHPRSPCRGPSAGRAFGTSRASRLTSSWRFRTSTRRVARRSGRRRRSAASSRGRRRPRRRQPTVAAGNDVLMGLVIPRSANRVGRREIRRDGNRIQRRTHESQDNGGVVRRV